MTSMSGLHTNIYACACPHIRTHTQAESQENRGRSEAKPQAGWERQTLQAGLGAAKNSSI